MESRLSIAWTIIPFLCLCAGCQTTRKPGHVPAIVQRAGSTTAPANVDIRPFLAASQAGAWVYRRLDLRGHADKPEVEYVRRTSQERLFEGDTTWEVFHAVERQLAADGQDRVDRLSDSGGDPSALALRFTVDEPIALIPEDLKASESSVAATHLEYLDVGRNPRGHGDLTRTATIEGYEDVEVPAGRFPNCLRVRVELNLKIHWGPTIDWLMYVWLSPKAGDVKRVQQLSGWFLIFPFGSSFKYELVSYEPPAAPQPADAPVPLWKDGLIAFDHGIPAPRAATLLVNFAQQTPPLTKDDSGGSQGR